MKGSVRLPGIPKNTRIKEEQRRVAPGRRVCAREHGPCSLTLIAPPIRRCFFHACAEGDPQLIVLESTSAQLDIPYGAHQLRCLFRVLLCAKR
jgi:hypothetical protein